MIRKHKMRSNWVFFDLGNTLIDEREALRDRYCQLISVLAQHGYSINLPQIEAAMRRASEDFVPRPIVRVLSELLGEESKSPHILEQTKYGKALEKPYPEAAEVLELLAGRYRLGVIANQSAGTAARLRGFDLLRYFEVCVSSTEEGLAKPDPAIFDLALRRANCAGSDATMVGDRLDNDIEPARRLGMRTVRILQGYGKFQRARGHLQEPDHTISSLCELPRMLLDTV